MFCNPCYAFLLSVLFSCNNYKVAPHVANKVVAPSDTNAYLHKFITDVPSPKGYKRIIADSNSFAQWLRNIALKKDKTVYLFNGDEKTNQSAQYAVLDISVGDQNLQQCADAVMRLRAEYLYAQKEYSSIIFTDNENTIYRFTQPYNRTNFDRYLLRVFGMCGSASLAKQLKHTTMKEINSGDVIIRGGFPGHAVIVMDVAENDEGEKIYLLAQSYMPAQDIHVLVNPTDEALSPWYKVNQDKNILTPEYIFTSDELMKW